MPFFWKILQIKAFSGVRADKIGKTFRRTLLATHLSHPYPRPFSSKFHKSFSMTTDKISDFRFQWYQSDITCTIDIFVKNVKEVDCSFLSTEQQRLKVSFKDNQGKDYERCFFIHAPCQSVSHRIFSTKLEITLLKQSSAIWTDLESSKIEAGSSSADVLANERPPSYPTSYAKHKDLDWSRVATQELGKETSNQQDLDPSFGDYDDSEFDENNSMEGFFKKTYANASDDSKRAMNKSFVESEGTVLSSNWNDIKDRTVEPHPPGHECGGECEGH